MLKTIKSLIQTKLDLTLTLNDSKSEDFITSPVKKGFMIIRILVEKKDQKTIESYTSSSKKYYNKLIFFIKLVFKY